MTALHDLSADTLSSAYRAGQLSPVEVTRAALNRPGENCILASVSLTGLVPAEKGTSVRAAPPRYPARPSGFAAELLAPAIGDVVAWVGGG
jgi:hypothetical protein